VTLAKFAETERELVKWEMYEGKVECGMYSYNVHNFDTALVSIRRISESR
jgi:hypothetical protein